MYDSPRVRLRKRISHLSDNRERLADLQRLAPNTACERLAFDILHNYEALAAFCADLVNGADVWMIERGNRLSLFDKSLLCLLVRHPLCDQEFDSDLATQIRIFCEVDLTHCAFA